MAGIQLTRMSANAAYEELQKAYGILYCNPESDRQVIKVDSDRLEEAEMYLKSVNEWLLALKNE
jgi:hypothetical protein